jgi:hypothetical protein
MERPVDDANGPQTHLRPANEIRAEFQSQRKVRESRELPDRPIAAGDKRVSSGTKRKRGTDAIAANKLLRTTYAHDHDTLHNPKATQDTAYCPKHPPK